MRTRLILLGMLILVSGADALKIRKGGILSDQIVARGEVEAREKWELRAPKATSEYDKLTVVSLSENGIMVQTGDVVLEFDPTDANADLISAHQSYDAAQAQYELTLMEQDLEEERLKLALKKASLELEKADALLLSEEAKVMPRIEIEKSKIERKSAEIAFKDAKRALDGFSDRKKAAIQVSSLKMEDARQKQEELKEYVDSLKMKSPASGMLFRPFTRLNRQAGRVRLGSVVLHGETLLQVLNPISWQVTLYVREDTGSRLKAGMPAKIRLTSRPEEEYSGEVLSVGAISATRGERLGNQIAGADLKEIKIEIDFPKAPEWVRPSMTASVQIDASHQVEGYLVPLTHLCQNEKEVFVQTSNGSVPVIIQSLARSYAEVLGLKKDTEEIQNCPADQ